jgi:hypothetical protein
VENPASTSFESEFDAYPGVPIKLEATLVPLPYVVYFRDFDPSCGVTLDGEALGPIVSLGGTLKIPAPDPNKEYTVTVQCDQKAAPRAYPMRGLRPKGYTYIHP